MENQYYLHRQPTRIQVAQHYHSTLDAPSLQNVQSMLAAARQRNYQLGASYFSQKYGTSRKYEQLMHTMGLQPPQQPEHTPKDIHDFRSTQEYGEYVRAQLEQKKNEIVDEVIKQTMKQEGKKVKPTVQNPWTEVKRLSVVDKQVVESQYIDQFEKFREQKQRRAEVQTKQTKKQEPTSKPKKNYRKQLITKIYNEIDSNKTGYIEKLEFLEYLTDNKKVVAIFNLKQQELGQDLFSFHTNNEDTMTLPELLEFFGEDSQSTQPQQNVSNEQQKLIKNSCLLAPESIKLFERVFAEVDIHSDMLIPRQQYIRQLRQNLQVRKILLTPALFQPTVNRTVFLYRILDKIEQDQHIGTQQERKVKEFLTFKQFMKYFESMGTQSDRLNSIQFVKFIAAMNDRNRNNMVELPSSVVAVFERVVRMIHSTAGYFRIVDFIQRLKATPEYREIKDVIARKGAQADGLDSESIEQVLNRIHLEANQYVEFPELLMYFSRRGRPLEHYKRLQENNSKLVEQFKGSKIIAQAIKHMSKKEQQQEVLAYDSDPQIYNGSYLQRSGYQDGFRASRVDRFQNQSPIRSPSPNKILNIRNDSGGLSNSKFKGTFQSMMIADDNRVKSASLDKQKFRSTQKAPIVTIPEPFSFDAREQARKNIRSKDQNEQSVQEKKPLKVRQIPKAVLQVGLYQKIMTENQKRREEIKKNSIMITLATQKPFSFEKRDREKARKKNHYERQQFVFKAKPVPWFCSVDLLKKHNEEELLLRKQKISRMAQQSLALSKLPPRMQKNQMERKAQKLRQGGDYHRQNSQSKQRRVSEPPNFELLHKTFQQQLQRKKLAKRPTKVEAFNFTDSKGMARVKSQTSLQQIEEAAKSPLKQDPVQKARRLNQQQPKVRAASTLKYTQQVEKRRKEIEQKKKKFADTQKVQPKQFTDDLKPKLQEGIKHNLTAKQKETKQRKKQEQQAQKKKFESWRNEIIEKAKGQPLLVDRPLKRDQQLDRMKKLALISSTLDQNNVKGKDKDALFTKQELSLLKDYEYLKKNKKV